MSDQQAPYVDTPADAGPEGASGAAEQTQAEIDWAKRYNDLRPEYTRATQEAAELRQAQQYYELALTSDDADIRRQALEALGYQLDESPDDGDVEQAYPQDPYDQLRQELAQVQQRVDQREQDDENARQTDLIRSITDERLGQLPDLATEDQDWILAYAINALPALHEPGVPVPLPDIQAAYDVFNARETERQKTWAKTKRAPYVSSGGRDATEAPDPGTGHQARLNRAMLSLRNNMGDNE